ncbi:PRC-barrel domain-containing protein [Methanothrix sp.]|uniref:PRC-barrel domain-containing protein n=1 Tax=Methanothrix sp. TaxID=90426 RepID=UPI0032990BAD
MWRTSRSIAEKITANGPLWVKEAATNGSNRVSFFSQLQGMKIYDREGNAVGKLSDLALQPGDTLLEISRIVYTSNILRREGHPAHIQRWQHQWRYPPGCVQGRDPAGKAHRG